MAKKKKPGDLLTDLLAAAEPETVKNLVVHLSNFSPEMRRKCFDYLKQHVKLTAEQEINSEGEIVRALWWELYPDLEDMDSYGGGDEKTEYHVVGLIDDIEEKLAAKKVDKNTRRELIEEVIPFIKSGNAGLDDPLFALAYAACYSDEDWRSLAATLETMNKDWPTDHARRIYRKLGDRERYLELRKKKLVYGMDYYDLATFYWDEGNREQAIAVAEEGREKGQGRLDELRKFLSDRVLENGDRKRYLTLQFEQTIDHLTLDTYKAFQVDILKDENRWKTFAGKIKKDNLRRPAFQEELAKVIPGWRELV